MKLALTLRLVVMTTTHEGFRPPQSPLQPPKADPAAGEAESETCVPDVKLWVQSVGQAMPAGLLETLPLPPPERVTVSVHGEHEKCAVTVTLVLNRIVHVAPFAAVQPVHPSNFQPAFAIAVSVTDSEPSSRYVCEHVVPQLMNPSSLVIVPPGCGVTDRVAVAPWARPLSGATAPATSARTSASTATPKIPASRRILLTRIDTTRIR